MSPTYRARCFLPTPLRSIALAMLLLGMFLLAVAPLTAQSGTTNVRVLDIDGTITPPMAQYIDRGIRTAANDGFAVVVIEIDTPGGLQSAMDDITRSILESDVPVVAYVTPRGARAASAGVYITYAAHIAAMAPGTSIGSASPVASGGGEMSDTMQAKVTNDAVSSIRNLAELRGRNADWAERAVRDAENITADEALQLGVVDLLAPNLATLLNEIDGRTVPLASGASVTLATAGAETGAAGMTLVERVLQLLSDPTIAYLLLSIGSLGIFLELANPGGFVPGIIGVLSLILGLYSLGTLPVNWTGVLLIGVAFGLFLLDIFVVSFGLLLVAGLASFIIGSYLLIDTSVPGYDGVSRPIIWASAACIVGAAALIGTAALRVMRKRPATGIGALPGEIGTVRQALDPTGMVFVSGELWTATVADGSSLPVGARVEVTDIRGLRLLVRPVSATIDADDAPPPRSRGEGVIPVQGGVGSVTST